MKKMYFALLMLGLIMTSCGGSGDYTTDKDEVIALLKEIAKEEKGFYKESLDFIKETDKKHDEILKEYNGKESKLLKKAKKGNEDAINALEALRNLELNSRIDKEEMSKHIKRKIRAYRLSVRDIRGLNDADDLEDWEEDIDKINKKRKKAEKKYHEDVRDLDDND